jgi:hypothetical protein
MEDHPLVKFPKAYIRNTFDQNIKKCTAKEITGRIEKHRIADL